MPKTEQDDSWAARERLRVIERAFWWRGLVGRADLTNFFGVSQAQASGDLQKYLELNPGSLNYHTSRKRYEAVPNSQWVLTEPNFEEALTVFLAQSERVWPGQVGEGSSIAGVGLPERLVKPEITRCLMIGVLQQMQVEIKYFSLSSGRHNWRTVFPHAFGNDGYRWHVRAYCESNQAYRDFVIARMADIRWSEMHQEELPKDDDWETFEELRLQAHSELEPHQRRALEVEYGLKKGGVLTIKTRRAMAHYLKHHLKVMTGAETRFFERI